jgi:hypothetical protein
MNIPNLSKPYRGLRRPNISDMNQPLLLSDEKGARSCQDGTEHINNRLRLCTPLQADFALLAAGSLVALSDFTRAADDAPSSDSP